VVASALAAYGSDEHCELVLGRFVTGLQSAATMTPAGPGSGPTGGAGQRS
jgi:hypothetical protein